MNRHEMRTIPTAKEEKADSKKHIPERRRGGKKRIKEGEERYGKEASKQARSCPTVTSDTAQGKIFKPCC